MLYPKDTLWSDFFDVENCGLIARDEKAHWREKLSAGDTMVIACMLLYKSQGLRHLKIYSHENKRTMGPFIGKIRDTNQSRVRDGPKPIALGELNSFEFVGVEGTAEEGLVEQFALLLQCEAYVFLVTDPLANGLPLISNHL